MKRIFGLSLVVVLLQLSCSSHKTPDDVYFYLTQTQKNFITTTHSGDTSIWKSNTGLSDTVIQQPVVYNNYIISGPSNTDGKQFSQSGTYTYRVVGTNKLDPVIPTIGVYADKYNNSLLNTVTYNGHSPTGSFPNRVFGSVNYQVVYWWVLANGTDTLFWNEKGFLGYIESGVRVEKIK